MEIFEGFEATVLSHEMDHLDGILHIDIAEEILKMSVDERKVWRQSHGYKVYSKTGKYDLLKKLWKLNDFFSLLIVQYFADKFMNIVWKKIKLW